MTNPNPEYLQTANTLHQQLSALGANDRDTAIVSAIAALETLVRVPPHDSPTIDVGALEAKLPLLPITNAVKNALEALPSTGVDRGVYAIAALNRAGVVINVCAALEERTIELEKRIAQIEGA